VTVVDGNARTRAKSEEAIHVEQKKEIETGVSSIMRILQWS
jgi:hypothetical protein